MVSRITRIMYLTYDALYLFLNFSNSKIKGRFNRENDKKKVIFFFYLNVTRIYKSLLYIYTFTFMNNRKFLVN